MLSGGDGISIRMELVGALRRHLDLTKSPDVDCIDAARFWTQLRKRTGTCSYESVKIDRSGAQLAPRPPISLALARVPHLQWVQIWLTFSMQPEQPWWQTYLEYLGVDKTGSVSSSWREKPRTHRRGLSAQPAVSIGRGRV